jgi:hypothetical protein
MCRKVLARHHFRKEVYWNGRDMQTTLTIAVGDFSSVPDGQNYYDASVEFVDTATQKIKELAESAN